MTQNDQCLRVENLVVRYGDALVLDDISFSVKKGENFIIMEHLKMNASLPLARTPRPAASCCKSASGGNRGLVTEPSLRSTRN